MATAAGHRACRADCPHEGFNSALIQDLSRSIDACFESAQEGNRGHSALPSHRLTTHHLPPAVRVIRVAVLEPCQSLLKARVPAPTQLRESMQHPSRQPWDGALTLATCETAISRSCFEQCLSRRLKPRIGRIGAPLDCREEAPARSRIRPPQRHIARPAPVRIEVFDQRGHRIDGIGASLGTNHGRALRWPPHKLHQHPPMQVRPVRVQKPGKRVATK